MATPAPQDRAMSASSDTAAWYPPGWMTRCWPVSHTSTPRSSKSARSRPSFGATRVTRRPWSPMSRSEQFQ